MTDPPVRSRAFGPFSVSWAPDGGDGGDGGDGDPSGPPSVTVRICVLGELLWDATLAPTSPTGTFSVQLNTYSAAGTVGVSWLDPQARNGQLTGDTCVFTAPDQRMTFSGTIGVW